MQRGFRKVLCDLFSSLKGQKLIRVHGYIRGRDSVTVIELKSVGIDLALADGTFQADQLLTYEDYENYLSLIEPAIVHTLYGIESEDSLENAELIASQTDSPSWSEASDMLRELREEIEQAES